MIGKDVELLKPCMGTFLSKTMSHKQKCKKTVCACADIFTRCRYVKYFRKHSYRNLGIKGFQMKCGFPTLCEWRSSIKPKSDLIFLKYFITTFWMCQIKFNHIAGNTHANIEKSHPMVFFWLAIISYHKNPNLKSIQKSSIHGREYKNFFAG